MRNVFKSILKDHDATFNKDSGVIEVNLDSIAERNLLISEINEFAEKISFYSFEIFESSKNGNLTVELY